MVRSTTRFRRGPLRRVQAAAGVLALLVSVVLGLARSPLGAPPSRTPADVTVANLGALPPRCNHDSGAEGSFHVCRRTNEVFTVTSSAYSWRNDGGNDWTLVVDLNLSFPDLGDRTTLYWAAVSDDRDGYNPYTRDDPNNLTFFGDLASYDDHVEGTTQAVYQHCTNHVVCHLEYQDVPFAVAQGQSFYLPLTVQRLNTQNTVPPYQVPYCTCVNTSWDIQRDNYLLSVVPHPTSAAPPTAAFTAKLSGDAAHAWKFDASASHADAGIASYHWTFGDGATATTSTPTTTHTYKDASDHTASLVVVDSAGTSSSAATRTLVESAPVVNSTGDAPAVKASAGCDTGATVGSPPVPECTLRAAIQAVNAAGGDTITFAIAGAGTPVIHPSSPLPDVGRSVTLDATSQPNGGRVAIDGSSAGSDAIGFHLTDGTSTVSGFVLNGFKTAIQADGGSGHRIVGNRIGTDLAGTAVGVPGEIGIRVRAPHTRVGGTAAQVNVVVASSGIVTTGSDTEIVGNLVSVGADGSTPVDGNVLGGIVTGGPGTVISDNTVTADLVGIGALGARASGARITGNHVGTTRDGTASLPMKGYGVRIDGAAGATLSKNVIDTLSVADVSISGSPQYTINADGFIHLTAPSSHAGGTVTGGDATVRGNVIGLLGDATTAGPRGSEGVWAWAGAGHLVIDGNTIAGQFNTAVELDGGSGHVVTGNHLGTDRAGTTAYPTQEGLHLVGTSGAKIGGVGTAGNVIGGAHDAGMLLSDSVRSTTIAGNWIGVGRDGAALPNDRGIKIGTADHTTIGPDNVIGHNQTGIAVGPGATATVITGNRIGTRGTAATRAPNVTGIRIGDGSAPPPVATTIGPGNVISLNGTGIVSSGRKTRVTGNRIGTAATTDDPAPNGGAGLQVTGGDLIATGNTIAYDNPGVDVATTARVGLHGNRLFDDATAAIRHPGAPGAPDLLAAIRTTRGTTTRTLLVMTGLPPGDAGTVEVFANSSCDEPQARFVLALTKVKAAPAASLVVNIAGRANRSFFTVDYTDAAGNTSELSGCRPAARYPDTDGDGSPDVLEQLFGLPDSSNDPSLGVVYTDTDQLLVMKTAAGRFSGLGPVDDPSPLTHPAGLQLPYGLIDFEISDLPADGRTTVLISGGPGVALLGHGWAKYGRIPSGATAWYDFDYDTFTGTGAQTVSQGTPDEALSLTFVDGARGDDDGQRNGVIRDPGAPAIFAAAPPPAAPPAAKPGQGQGSLSATGTDISALVDTALLLLALGLATCSWACRKN